jgi:hypothetical protein
MEVMSNRLLVTGATTEERFLGFVHELATARGRRATSNLSRYLLAGETSPITHVSFRYYSENFAEITYEEPNPALNPMLAHTQLMANSQLQLGSDGFKRIVGDMEQPAGDAYVEKAVYNLAVAELAGKLTLFGQ